MKLHQIKNLTEKIFYRFLIEAKIKSNTPTSSHITLPDTSNWFENYNALQQMRTYGFLEG